MEFPNIDPVAISLGPVQIHWYGLMYMIGFAAAWLLIRRFAKKPGSGWTLGQVDDLIFYCALGVVLGGRLGYTVFYNLGPFLQNPLIILRIWEGGMSFHGGILGVTVAMWLFARKTGHPFLTWGVVFPNGGPLPRHPSQLYEFALEGVLLFCILGVYSRFKPPMGAIAAALVFFYGLFRFIVEFFRMPDQHLKDELLFGWMSRGQVLSAPMMAIGLVVLVWVYQRSKNTGEKK